MRHQRVFVYLMGVFTANMELRYYAGASLDSTILSGAAAMITPSNPYAGNRFRLSAVMPRDSMIQRCP
jgi:hypothetical protein